LFTYSLIRPAENISYYQAIKDTTHSLDCPIDGLHTESGPVYEASLKYDSIERTADRGAIFKYLIKCIAPQFNITPTFMAKPASNMPGSSGHVHISLVDFKDRNRRIFDRQDRDENSRFQALEYVSDSGRSFLAGLLDGIPDILPLLCPTVNSYKRLGHRQHWTAGSVSWGVDNRNASVRVIAGGASGGTRFECRVPGADANAPYVLAALIGCGLRGMEKKLDVTMPPLEESEDTETPGELGSLNGQTQGQQRGQRTLSRTLKEAVIDMTRNDSVAREIFGEKFVEQFAATRMREVRCFEDVVTDWYVLCLAPPVYLMLICFGNCREVSRYLERV
jgi:glutamine synthetase